MNFFQCVLGEKRSLLNSICNDLMFLEMDVSDVH